MVSPVEESVSTILSRVPVDAVSGGTWGRRRTGVLWSSVQDSRTLYVWDRKVGAVVSQ